MQGHITAKHRPQNAFTHTTIHRHTGGTIYLLLISPAQTLTCGHTPDAGTLALTQWHMVLGSEQGLKHTPTRETPPLQSHRPF